MRTSCETAVWWKCQWTGTSCELWWAHPAHTHRHRTPTATREKGEAKKGKWKGAKGRKNEKRKEIIDDHRRRRRAQTGPGWMGGPHPRAISISAFSTQYSLFFNTLIRISRQSAACCRHQAVVLLCSLLLPAHDPHVLLRFITSTSSCFSFLSCTASRCQWYSADCRQ
jgi:hypothetical protein